MTPAKLILPALMLGLLACILPLQAADKNWAPIAEQIIVFIDEAENHYQEGNLKKAKQSIVKAYFGVFEDRKMEAAMRMELGSKHTYLVEKLFGTLRKAMTKGAPETETAAIAESIRVAMRRDAQKLDQAGIPLEVFRVNQ
jgi:hypothetical protein